MFHNPNNFLQVIKQTVTGGGNLADGVTPRDDSGFLVDVNASVADLSPPILTDNTGGTVSTTLAAAAAKNVIIIPIPDMTKLANSQIFEVLMPYAFTVNSALFRTNVAVSTGAKAATFTAGVDGSAMTGGVIVVSGTQATGVATNSTSITAGNTGTATNKVSFTVSSVTTFVEGEGQLEVTVTNTDLANTLSSLAKAANGNLAASETNLVVFSSPASTTTIGTVNFTVPRDYDEATDHLSLHLLAASAGATDTPTITATVYRKRAGSNIATAATVAGSVALTSAQQTVKFFMAQKGFKRDDTLTIVLSTTAHTTDAILIYGMEPVYRSTLVSYAETDNANGKATTGTILR